jgi:hypothetical protein
LTGEGQGGGENQKGALFQIGKGAFSFKSIPRLLAIQDKKEIKKVLALLD